MVLSKYWQGSTSRVLRTWYKRAADKGAGGPKFIDIDAFASNEWNIPKKVNSIFIHYSWRSGRVFGNTLSIWFEVTLKIFTCFEAASESHYFTPRVVAKAKSVLLRCVRTYAVCDLPWSRQQCRLEKGIKQQSVHTIQCKWISPSKKKMTTKYLLVLVCLVVYLFNKPNQNVAEAMPMKFMCDMCESNWIHCLMKCHM